MKEGDDDYDDDDLLAELDDDVSWFRVLFNFRKICMRKPRNRRLG